MSIDGAVRSARGERAGSAIEFLKTAGFSLAAAVGCGIVHDRFTAHVCVEYFTVAQPPVFGTGDPFLLALGWVVIATWWVGLPLGLGLGAVVVVWAIGRRRAGARLRPA